MFHHTDVSFSASDIWIFATPNPSDQFWKDLKPNMILKIFWPADQFCVDNNMLLYHDDQKQWNEFKWIKIVEIWPRGCEKREQLTLYTTQSTCIMCISKSCEKLHPLY